MKKTDNTKLITVGELVKELAGYEKKHWDWNVEITAEGVEGEEEDPTCIITGMGLDEDGDLRIEIEEEWAGGGDYYVGELLEQLRDFDASTRVYLAGGGLLFSIDSQGGIFAKIDEDDDTLSCYATAFGEYEGGILCAAAPILAKNRRFALIGNLFTLPEHRGRGCAARLLAACEAAAAAEGLRPVLYCYPAMARYYLARGYRILEQHEV